jgi:hypothetical protein
LALWNIPFYHINLHHADVNISGATGKLDRNTRQVQPQLLVEEVVKAGANVARAARQGDAQAGILGDLSRHGCSA